MILPEEFATITVSRMLAEHPRIGEILSQYQIDCVTCGSSSCLFKNIIATHTYDSKKALRIEKEISEYFSTLSN